MKIEEVIRRHNKANEYEGFIFDGDLYIFVNNETDKRGCVTICMTDYRIYYMCDNHEVMPVVSVQALVCTGQYCTVEEAISKQ